MSSTKPRKQRMFIRNAALHIKRKFLGARLSEDHTTKMGTRTLTLRVGDEVKVMRGDFRGVAGKITKIDIKRSRVFIDTAKRKKTSGEEVPVAFHPSKVMITSPVMDDAKRKKIIERKKVK